MSGIEFAGFVCDEDSLRLAASLPRKLIAPLPKIGIEMNRGTPDPAVVQHAREHGRIVITGNTLDYLRAMNKAVERCTPMQCFDGGGLITVPASVSNLRYKTLTRYLAIRGVPVTWEDVFVCNLHVDVKQDGVTTTVRQLPICQYFKSKHVARCDRCQAFGLTP